MKHFLMNLTLRKEDPIETRCKPNVYDTVYCIIYVNLLEEIKGIKIIKVF